LEVELVVFGDVFNLECKRKGWYQGGPLHISDEQLSGQQCNLNEAGNYKWETIWGKIKFCVLL
jgi:hypothetical protein